MLKAAPGLVDVQDLQFKLRCRLKVFENGTNDSFSKNCSLVAAASRFGLVFIGSPTPSFQAVQVRTIEDSSTADGIAAESQYLRRETALPSPPKFLSVNCEHTILAVVVERDGCDWALFYDVKSFWQQNVVKLDELRLSTTPGVGTLEVNWNPALGAVFTACKTDGTLGVYELKSPGIEINELPPAAGATCFSWSPKGKQIAVGSRDGRITQYKPDLKAVKVIAAPPLKGEQPQAILSLKWVSNYQFMGVYQAQTVPDAQASLVVIDVPKSGETSFTNYEDICYSSGNARPAQFYMILVQHWNIMMMASSNSMEVGVLGLTSNDTWTQWAMGDASRAELPMSADRRQETYPVGMALDIASTKPIPWGEQGGSLPPSPYLLLMSHHGVLCCFNVINLKPDVPSICTPPDHLQDTSGDPFFVAGSKPPPPQSQADDKPAVNVQQQQATPSPDVQQQQQHQVQPQQVQTPASIMKSALQQKLAAAQPAQPQQLPTKSVTFSPNLVSSSSSSSIHNQQNNVMPTPNTVGTPAAPLGNTNSLFGAWKPQLQPQPQQSQQQQQQQQQAAQTPLNLFGGQLTLTSVSNNSQQQQQLQQQQLQQQQLQQQQLQQQLQQRLAMATAADGGNEAATPLDILAAMAAIQRSSGEFQKPPPPAATSTPSTFAALKPTFVQQNQPQPLTAQQPALPPMASALKIPSVTRSDQNIGSGIVTNREASLIPKQEMSSPASVAQGSNATSAIKKENTEDSAQSEELYAQMVREECLFLESELKALLHQGRSFRCNLGTEADKTNLLKVTESLEEFLKEVVDISTAQNAEVHCLKQNLLQSFAWYEEAKSRHLSAKDEAMALILRAQPLDSASEKQLEDIRHMSYYLESQLTQANKALDEQWDSFQDYCRKTVKTQMPTMEAIFQAMVKQNAIIQRQSYILKDIGNRIKNKSRSPIGPSLLRSLDNPEELEEELKRLRLNADDIAQIQYQHIVNRTKNLTKTKVDKLRNFLINREFPHISVVKPQQYNSVMSQTVSPSSRLKQLSMLEQSLQRSGSGGTRNSDMVVPKKLDFGQPPAGSNSMPSLKTTEVPPNTPIDGLKNFTYKFEAENFSKPFQQGFVPLTKSQSTTFGLNNKTSIPSGIGSAFASTYGSSSTSVTAPVASLALGTSTPKTAPSYVISSTATISTTTSAQSQPVLTMFNKPQNSTSGNLAPVQGTIGTATTKPAFSFLNQQQASGQSGSSVLATSSSAPSFFGGLGGGTTSAPGGTTSSIFQGFKFQPSASAASGGGTQSIFGNAAATSSSSSIFGGSTSEGTTAATALGDKQSFKFSTVATAPKTNTAQPVKFSAQSFGFGTATNAASTTSVTTTTSVSSSAANQSTKPSIFGAFTPLGGGSTSTASSRIVVPSNQPDGIIITSVFSAADAGNTSTPTTKSSVAVAPVTSSGTASSTAQQTPITAGGVIVRKSSQATPATDSSQQSSTGSTAAETTSSTSETNGSASTPSTVSVTSTTIPKSSGFVPVSTTPGTQHSSQFFGTTPAKPLIFGSATGSTTATPTTTTTSVFGAGGSAVTTGASVFSTATTADSTTPKTSMFGGGTTKGSILGSATSPVTITPVGTASTQSSVVGSSTSSTSQSSVFGTAATATAASMSTTAASTTSQSSIFGGTIGTSSSQSSSVFGNTSSTSAPSSSIFQTALDLSRSPITQSSVFGTSGTNTTTTSQQSSVFGTPSSTSATGSTSTQSSIFGTATGQGSIFGTASNMGGTTQQSSIFGNASSSAPTTTTTQQSSIFGAALADGTTAQSSIFGSAAAAVTTTPPGQQGSIFGNVSTAVSSQQGSIFGGTASTPTGRQSSIFGGGGGGAPTTAATLPGGGASSGSIFGGGFAGVAGQQKTSIFGGGTGTAATSSQPSSIFGGASGGSIFGGSTASGTTSTASSPFGQQQQQPPPTQSIFGQAPAFGTPSSGSSIFGTAPPSSGSTSIFGSTAAPQGGASSVFGSSTGGSIFGSAPITSSGGGTPAAAVASPFGTAANGTSAVGPFGGGSTTTGGSIFAASPSGSQSQQQSSSFSFASASNTSGAGGASFGFGSLNVGSTPTTSSGFGGFGASPASQSQGGPPPNPFGLGTQKQESSLSTAAGGSIFGGGSGSSGGSIFGGGTSTFGGASSTSSIFGGQQQQSSSIFGQASSGAPGPFSAGSAGTVGQSGFGAGGFQKPVLASPVAGGGPSAAGSTGGGFGSAPVFGGSPAFGAAPSFGATPAFGAAPAFGTPAKVFGGGAATTTGFGSPAAAQSTSFGNLANQPTVDFGNIANQQTMGFGNLAQQAASQSASSPFSGGGTSFSSWR